MLGWIEPNPVVMPQGGNRPNQIGESSVANLPSTIVLR